MIVLIDGVQVGRALGFANERDSHEAFVTDYAVVEGLPAGDHTIRLEPVYESSSCNTASESPFDVCMSTNSNDFFDTSVVEIPAG